MPPRVKPPQGKLIDVTPCCFTFVLGTVVGDHDLAFARHRLVGSRFDAVEVCTSQVSMILIENIVSLKMHG